MKKLIILFVLAISLFSCNKEEKTEGLSYYKFAPEPTPYVLKDTTYYYNTAENREYKFWSQVKTPNGFTIQGDLPNGTQVLIDYTHAKKKKDRELKIYGGGYGAEKIFHKNPVISEGKITFDGGEIYKVK